jgi:hypothetical protein
MVLGILWVGGLGALLAVIFGNISRRKARRDHRKTSYMARAGLVLGWIGLAGAVVQWYLVAGVLATPG